MTVKLPPFFLLGMTMCLASCARDFDTERVVVKRESLGRELYSVICDRVGAQALREDVTGASYRNLCRPDAIGRYAEKVDVTKLVPLDKRAVDERGRNVPLDVQEAHRAHRIARVETLARRREEIVRALEAALPDAKIPRVCARSPNDAGAQELSFRSEFARTLGQLSSLYTDRTIPDVTAGLGDIFSDLERATDAQRSFARVGAREGYRPARVALGVLKPALSYPRLVPLAQSVLKLIAGAQAPARGEFRQLLAVLHGELAELEVEPKPVLRFVADPSGAPRQPSRPRTSLELAEALLLAEEGAFGSGRVRPLVRRDRRGVATVFASGSITSPFVDANRDGLADLDSLGGFVTTARVPTPFAVAGVSEQIARDAFGRVGAYVYLDADRTYLAAFARDLGKMFIEDRPASLLDVAAGLGVVGGLREPEVNTVRQYPRGHRVAYRAFRPDTSPLVELATALSPLLADKSMDDVLALAQAFATEHPALLARLADALVRAGVIANRHPEAVLPERSTLWDDLSEVVVRIAREPGLLEDLIGAMSAPETSKLALAFAGYWKHKDAFTYDRANLGGLPFNITLGKVAEPSAPVDRKKPDTGENRSVFQRFLQALHDVNGLTVCSKEGALVHMSLNGSELTFPTDPLARTACSLVGASAPPARIPACGILRIENLATEILKVSLGRYRIQMREPCMAKLIESRLLGDTDRLMAEASGIPGFGLTPTLQGLARFAYFDVAQGSNAGDLVNAKTHRFVKDFIEPIPTMICLPVPFKDPLDQKNLTLRRCTAFSDTLRGRDGGALFPLEFFGFLEALKPVATAFLDHQRSEDFVSLLDTLHRHWGSERQSADECRPQGPPSDPRSCTGDGLVRYEPLLAEVFESALLPTLGEALQALGSMSVSRCTRQDPKTFACTAREVKSGRDVLAEFLRVLVEPARLQGSGGAKDAGVGGAKSGKTPLSMLLSALSTFDARLADWQREHPDDPGRRSAWNEAWTRIGETFFAAEGQGQNARFKNPATRPAILAAMALVREELAARCPMARTTGICPWAREEMPRWAAETVRGALFASSADLALALGRSNEVESELSKALGSWLGASDPKTFDVTLSAAVDTLQSLEDEESLVPILKVGSNALWPIAPEGAPARSSLVESSLATLARVLDVPSEPGTQSACDRAIDPQRTFPFLLERLVTPLEGDRSLEPTPVEVLADVIADVNRISPGAKGPLTADDYRSIASELRAFLVDPESGLEQLYALVQEVTPGQGDK